MSSKPGTLKYSIIVPAYQAADVITDCIRALDQQTMPREFYEILVVDDGSTDETAALARTAGADTVLHCPHQGPSGARNAGIQAAMGDIVLFTDADCEPAADWLEHMVAPFAESDVTGTKGAYHTRQHELVARLVQMEYEVRYERMACLPRIDFIDTYAAAYRREVLIRYGGFDLAYPIPSAEDVDLSFRLARDGHKLHFVPEARVYHRHPTSLRHYLLRKGRYGFWRALLYLRYPDKIGGDAHTDPTLKLQFCLLGLMGLACVGSLLWLPLATFAAAALAVFLATTWPFLRWAWPRDHQIALVWAPITLMRVTMQAGGLAVGLVRHSLMTGPLSRRAPIT